jgi:hypothetical protein
MEFRIVLITIALVCASISTGEAHHSLSALYDTSQTVEVTGKVIRFEFKAPHSYIHLAVSGESGQPVTWEVESYPPGMLIRKGVTPEVLHPGDEVSVVGIPSRDGRPLMRLLSITLPGGEERQIQ